MVAEERLWVIVSKERETMKKWAIGFGVATAGGLGFGIAYAALDSCGGLETFCYTWILGWASIPLLCVGILGLIGVRIAFVIRSRGAVRVRKDDLMTVLANNFGALSLIGALLLIAVILGAFTPFEGESVGRIIALGLTVIGILGLLGVWAAARTRFLTNKWAARFWMVTLVGLGAAVYGGIMDMAEWAAFWSDPRFSFFALSLLPIGVLGLIGVCAGAGRSMVAKWSIGFGTVILAGFGAGFGAYVAKVSCGTPWTCDWVETCVLIGIALLAIGVLGLIGVAIAHLVQKSKTKRE